MSPSTATAKAALPSAGTNTSAFWERLWGTAGIQFVVLFVVSCVIYGYQPRVGASPDELVAFYTGDRTRILIAAACFGLNIVNLLWFAAALRAALAAAGQAGWGAAATASSSAIGALYLLFVSVVATLAYSVAAAGNTTLTSALNDFAWVLIVLSSFPRAMLIMSGTFGSWRAGLISNGLFSVGVGAVVLGILSGTTWLSGGLWAPDGIYSRLIVPAIGLLWILVVSRVLLGPKSSAHAAW